MNQAIKKIFSVLLAVVLVLSVSPVLAQNADGTECGLQQHTHAENCFKEDAALACEMEEHEHGKGCYPVSNPAATLFPEPEETGETDIEANNPPELESNPVEIEEPETEHEDAVFVQSQIVNNISVSVSAPAGVFPAGAALSVRLVEDEAEVEQIEQAITETLQEEDGNKAIISTTSFDITVVDAKGMEIQPDTEKGEVSVSFSGVDTTYEGVVERNIEVFHVDTQGETPEAAPVETVVEAETAQVAVQAEHFSIYTLTETGTALPTAPNTQLTSGVVYTAPAGSGTTNITATTTGQSGLRLPGSGVVVIYIPVNRTLNVTGAAGSGRSGGGAGILVPSGGTLVLAGEGTLTATGGSSGSPSAGSAGGSADRSGTDSGNYVGVTFYSGTGGAGGSGAGSAGAGIGGAGQNGGTGGAQVDSVSTVYSGFGSVHGKLANSGSNGTAGQAMGTVHVLEKVTVNANAGSTTSTGSTGGSGGTSKGWYHKNWTQWDGFGSGGGGGGGGYAGTSAGIGGSGAGGGGGGSGSSGAAHENKNYSECFFYIGSGGGGGGGGGSRGTSSTSFAGYQGVSTPQAIGDDNNGGARLNTGTAAGNGSTTGSSGNGGNGGGSTAYTYTGGTGGARPAGGAAGTLYKASTATINISGSGGSTANGHGASPNQGTPTSYNVTHNLTNISPIAGTTVNHYAGYAITLVPQTGYVLPSSITVTRGSTTLTNGSHYSYTPTIKGSQPAGRVVIPYTQVTGDITITAAATAQVTAVTFSSVAGSAGGPASAVNFTYSQRAPTIPPHTRAGYTLEGYFTAPTDGTKVYEATGAAVAALSGYTDADGKWVYTWPNVNTKTLTLYAQWTGLSYTLKFDAQGGSGEPAQEVISMGESVTTTSITPPTREGYTFGGYYSARGGAGVMVYDSTGALQNNVAGFIDASGNWIHAGNATLFAKWTPAQYTVTFDDQGGSDGPGSTTIEYLQMFPQSTTITPPTKAGEHFEGYYGEPGRGGLCYYYADGTATRNVWNKQNNGTLYAAWRSSPYPSFLQNGGFEDPILPPDWRGYIAESTPGLYWQTTCPDGLVELARPHENPSLSQNTYNTTAPYEGYQFAEINANEVGALYQIISTTPGDTLTWSLAHRGQTGSDDMQVWIGTPQDVETAVWQYAPTTNVNKVNKTLIKRIQQVPNMRNGASTTNNGKPELRDKHDAWGTWGGTYTVPAGQTETMFAFVSVGASGNNPAVGNLMDAIFFGNANDIPKTKTPVTIYPSNGGIVEVFVNGMIVGSTENGAVIIEPEEGQEVSFNIIPGTDYVKHGGTVKGDFPGLSGGGLNGEYVDDNTISSYGWTVGEDFDGQREITFLFAKKGTVSFNPLAGSYTPDDAHSVDALEHTLSVLDPTCEIGAAKRRGTRFIGWQVAGTAYTLAEGSTVKYETSTGESGVEVDLVAYAPNNGTELFRVNAEQSGIVLVAQYEVVSVPTVRINLGLDGGRLNGMPDPEIESDPDDPGIYAVLNGSMSEYTLGTPVKPGYTFGGWKRDASNNYSAGTKFAYAVDENNDFATTLTIGSNSPEPLTTNQTIALTAQWTIVPATSPTINTPPAANTELVYGYEDEVELIVGALPAPPGEEQTYQWYICDKEGSSKVAITGATGPDYTFPAGEDAGDYYFICEVTNTRPDNGATKTKDSGVAKITVNPRPITLTWSQNSFQYDGNEKSITATVQNVVPGDTVTVTGYTDNQKTDGGDYIAVANGLSDPNYTLTGGTNTQKSWSITNRVITVSANDYTITYGDAPSGGGVTYSGFVPGEDESMITGTVSYTFNYSRYGDIGSYTITPVITGLYSTNYTFRVETGTLTVKARPVALSWSEGDFTYDGMQKSVTATVANAVSSDAVTVTAYTNNQKTNAGSYTARATSLSDPNYTLTGAANVANSWLIRKKQPVFTTGTTNVNSAGSEVEIPYDYSGDGTVSAVAANNEEERLRLTVNPADGKLTIEPTPALKGQNHTIEVTLSASEGTNYEAAEDIHITVNVYDGKISVVANSYSGVYDAAEHGVSVTNAIPNTDIRYSETEGGSYSLTEIKKKDVGNYIIYYEVSGPGLGSDTIKGSAVIAIEKRALAIAANDNTITYGDAPIDNGYTVSGSFATGEGISDAAGGVTYAHAYSQYGNVGSYDITPEAAGTESDNYDITWNNGTLLVKAKTVTITWDTTGDPFSYDGTEKSIAATVSGLVNNDPATLLVTGDKGIGVNNYTAIVSGVSSPNYTIEGAVNITQTWQIDKGAIGAPSLTGIDETVDGKNDGRIPGADLNMEYWDPGANNGNGEWKPITPEMIDAGGMVGLAPGDYDVRYKETDNYDASLVTTVTIGPGAPKNFTLVVVPPVFGTVFVGYERPEAKPITITNQGNWGSTISDVAISGADAGKFTLTGSATAVPEKQSITDYAIQPAHGLAAGSYSVTITVTYDNSAEATAAMWFHVAKRTVSAPGVSAVDETMDGDKDGKITGIGPGMEYSDDGGNTWKKVTQEQIDAGEITGLPPGDYQVRYAETDETEPSPATGVTVGRGPAKGEGNHNIEGVIKDDDKEEITVYLYKGSELIDTVKAVPDKDNPGQYIFKFKNVPEGIYNIVADNGSWKVTHGATVGPNGVEEKIIIDMGTGKTQSIVEIKPGLPAVAVTGLPGLFDSDRIYTPEDRAFVEEGGMVEMKLLVEETTQNDADAITAAAGEKAVAIIYDLFVVKSWYDKDGALVKEEYLTDLHDKMLIIRMEMPADANGKSSYAMLRLHDGSVQNLTRHTDSLPGTEECWWIDHGILNHRVQRFSTYALTYDKGSAVDGSGRAGPSTGDNTNLPLYLVLLIGAAGALLDVLWRRKNGSV